MWPVEDIPKEDKLYYRIHDSFLFANGQVTPGVFKERGEGEGKGMSTDWNKYSSAEQSLSRTKIPEKNSICSFVVQDLIDIKLKIAHFPLDENQAHTNVKNLEDEDETEKRLKLLGAIQIEIRSPLMNKLNL